METLTIIIGIWFIHWLIDSSERRDNEIKQQKIRECQRYQDSRSQKPDYYLGTQEDWELERELEKNERAAYERHLMGKKEI